MRYEVGRKNLQEESFKTDTKADSHQGDVAKLLKEIVTAKGNEEKVSKDNPLSLSQVRMAQKRYDVKDIRYERERTERDIQGFGGAGLGTAAVRYASAVL